MKAFDRYQSALHRGDYSATKEHMLTFFVHTAQRATWLHVEESTLYEAGLTQLLSSPLLSTLSMREYTTWQAQIWRVLWLRARRRAESGAMQRLRALCRDVTAEDWVYAWEGPSSAPGKKGKRREMSRYVVLQTADRLLHEYGQRTEARPLLDGVMPELLEDDDLEVRGIVQMLYGQSILTEDPSHGES
ncbi:unnamed protein product [Tilletia controversa]|nr:unnamed protein product [Tilletia controversa]